MSNGIAERQNESHEIDKLAAQRQLYSDAKNIQLSQLFLSVPASLIWPVFVVLAPSVAIYSAIWGIAITVLDNFVLSRKVSNLRLTAARIQESFDCYVMSIGWHSLHSGREPGREVIQTASKRFQLSKGDRELLKTWYPEKVDEIPLPLARIVCQRASCWWDGELRRRFSYYASVITAGILLISIIIGVSANFTLAQYVMAIVMPFLPVVIFAWRQITENLDAARSIDNLREHSENIWKDAITRKLNSRDLDKESRDLQCEIFTHRKNAPLIFDWLYFRLRSSHEETMNIGADDLVAEAKHLGH